jgi:hypothetical protein
MALMVLPRLLLLLAVLVTATMVLHMPQRFALAAFFQLSFTAQSCSVLATVTTH